MNNSFDISVERENPSLITDPVENHPSNPDNPTWGLWSAFLVWLTSVLLILIVPNVIITIYLLTKFDRMTPELLANIVTSKSVVLILISSIVPVYILTLGVAWCVVTGFGRFNFWKQLGWSWDTTFGLWKSLGLAAFLFLFGALVTEIVGGEKTDIDKLIDSSVPAGLLVVFVATAGAPLVEEIVYRGVLFSAIKKTSNTWLAVFNVSILFAGVHYFQYQANLGVFAVVVVLSIVLTIVRARTNRLLPCYIIHLAFNGIQALIILFRILTH
ncbi:MAG: lysostaphin resistance A-like protein [Pyrinomonadaceae bacterium]